MAVLRILLIVIILPVFLAPDPRQPYCFLIVTTSFFHLFGVRGLEVPIQ